TLSRYPLCLVSIFLNSCKDKDLRKMNVVDKIQENHVKIVHFAGETVVNAVVVLLCLVEPLPALTTQGADHAKIITSQKVRLTNLRRINWPSGPNGPRSCTPPSVA